MGLKAFHVAFIFLANLLSVGLGFWCLNEAAETGDVSLKILGVISLIGFAALVIYSVWFLKKWKNLSYFGIAFAALGLLIPEPAMACAVCLGDPNSPMVKGAKAGVWVLLAIIAFLLVGFGAVFLRWRQKEKALL